MECNVYQKLNIIYCCLQLYNPDRLKFDPVESLSVETTKICEKIKLNIIYITLFIAI